MMKRIMIITTTTFAIAAFGTVLPTPTDTLLSEPIAAATPAVKIGAVSIENAVSDRFGGLGGSPMASTSASRCSTTYGASAPHYGPSTDYFTSTSYAYRIVTQLLTPKPFTTSVSATSTYTEYYTAPNNLTETIYTGTSTWTRYLTTTAYFTSTSTKTTSIFSTTTIATPTGFTPVAAVFPEAQLNINDQDDAENWAVEDSYWQNGEEDQWDVPRGTGPVAIAGGGFVPYDAPRIGYIVPTQTGVAFKIECLITLLNIYNAGTSTSKSYASPPTYTRTTYVATETITSTVRTRILPTETPTTVTTSSSIEVTSWYTETLTKTTTTTTTEYPSSISSVYAACSTGNIVNSYKGFSQLSLADDWYSKNLTIIQPDMNNATACCTSAVSFSNAIFFKYDGWCEIFLDDHTNSTWRTTGKTNVEVLYVPKEPDWYGGTYGNGPLGSISFSSLWL